MTATARLKSMFQNASLSNTQQPSDQGACNMLREPKDQLRQVLIDSLKRRLQQTATSPPQSASHIDQGDLSKQPSSDLLRFAKDLADSSDEDDQSPQSQIPHVTIPISQASKRI